MKSRLLFAAACCGVVLGIFSLPAMASGPSSTNLPLDHPLYEYVAKLSGFGLISTDVSGLKPFSRSEAARLLLEAEAGASAGNAEPFAMEILERGKTLVAREVSLYRQRESAPLADFNPLTHLRARSIYLSGVPRDYERNVFDPCNQSAFGFIGGNLRPSSGLTMHMTGSEGTPLVENNEGGVYRRGFSRDLLFGAEGYLTSHVSVAVEPRVIWNGGDYRLYLNKAYLTIGSGGAALEAGRDANWFGPGYRGTTTLTNNAQNFDAIKLWSPEPIDVGWVKRYLGQVKYAFVFSRFDRTATVIDGEEPAVRRPYFFGAKIAVKPSATFEIGLNFVRQAGGPGLKGSSSLQDTIFGGGNNDGANTIAGLDFRFRIPSLRNSELYVEYSGEDSAAFWPFVESYIAGIYIPRLTADGRTDLRLEYFWGSRILYTDWQFPGGYVYKGMSPGHSQGGATQDVFVRLGHYLSLRNHVVLEYFHTERGNEGRLDKENKTVETKNAVRAAWSLPLFGETGLKVLYGFERVHALNLERNNSRVNHLVMMEIRYPQ